MFLWGIELATFLLVALRLNQTRHFDCVLLLAVFIFCCYLGVYSILPRHTQG